MHQQFRDLELEAMRQKVANLEKALTVARKVAAVEARSAQLARESSARAWLVALRPAVKTRDD